MSPAKTSSFAIALLLLVTAAPTPAASKINLDRVAPVPATEQIPVVDFFRPPLFYRPVLNKSGTYFAALVDTGNDRTAMLVCDLKKMKTRVVDGSSNRDFNTAVWLDDTHVLSNLITDKQYAFGLHVTNAIDVTDNYAIEANSATAIVGVPRGTPMRPLVWIYRNAYDDGKDMGVVQLNAAKRIGGNRDAQPGSMQEKMQREETDRYGARASILKNFPEPAGSETVVDYLADKDGGLAYAFTAKDGIYRLHRLVKNEWVASPLDLDLYNIVDVGDKPDELIAAGPREEGKPRALYRVNAATGQLGDVLYQDKNYDVTNGVLYRHPQSGDVLGLKFSRASLQTIWFHESYRTVQKMVDTQFPNQIVQILGSDTEENRFFVSSYSDRQPVTYYLLDLKAHSLGLIKGTAPWIDPQRMQPMNVMKFKTRDGHQLEAFLTMPAGASKDNPAPLVVLSHGGPWARDSWGFNGEVQFLASRGYAVLQTNYRGSIGYNWMFPVEDQWAFRKMHEDVTDAVKYLSRSGLIDPKRIAIMGTSFGGYLALCGAAFEPDLYRCAVSVAGVFDWEQMIRNKKLSRFENPTFGLFLRNLGDPKAEQEKFDAISPLRHIDQIHVPVFVSHGKDDQNVDAEQSTLLVSQLKKYQVPYETYFVGGEGHGMAFLEHQIELYTRIEAFLAKNLAPAKPAATTASAN